MNQVRILKVLSNFFMGGTERQFVRVANGLDPSRFAVEIGCFKREGPLLGSLNPDLPLHTYPLDRTLYSRRSLLSQLRLIRDVHARKFDIVHTYGWYPNVFAIPASRLACNPLIIASIRDVGAYMTPAKISALKCACVLADCVLANSYAGRHWLIEQGVNEKKIEVVRNGIDVALEKRTQGVSPLRKEFGIPAETPICACIGRVVAGKGIEFYLRAARIIVDRGRDVRFLMIGSQAAQGHYQSDLESFARQLNLEKHMIFTGQRHDVTEMLRDVDILVHPSLTEGLSNVILEAMSAGLPVVATRVGGNPELVEDERTGFLVSVESAEEIAAAIGRLLDRPEMGRAFGLRARQRVMDEFTVNRMLANMEELYYRLLEQRGRFRFTATTARPEKPASFAGKTTLR